VLAHGDGEIFRSWPGQMPNAETAPSAPVAAGMLAGGNRFAMVRSDGSITLYDIRSGTVRQLVRSGSHPTVYVAPQEAAVSPDGRAAVVSGVTTQPPSVPVTYVDLLTGTTHQVGADGALGVLFTRDSLVIERPTGGVEIWDAAGRRRLGTLPGTGQDTGALAISPDGTVLARLRNDDTVSLADVATGDVLVTFSLPPPTSLQDPDPWRKTAMLFTPDGRSLLTATSGGQLIRWAVNPPDVVRNICATVGHTLTATQWRQYAGTSPPVPMPCAS
jgi:WD40 repeat protein